MKIIKGNKSLILAVISIMILFFLRDVLSHSFNQYIEVVFVALFIPFLNYKSLNAYSCFLIPIITGMNTIICLFLLIGLIIKSPRINRLQIIFPIALLAIELMNFVFYPNTYRINDYLLYASVLSLVFFLVFDKTKSVDYALNIKLYCISTAFVMMLIMYRSYDTFGPAGIFMNRLGDVDIDDFYKSIGHRVFSMNANNVGYFSLIAFCCLLLGTKRLKLNIIMYIIILIAVLAAGALSVSRTWIILVLLTTIVYASFYVKKWVLCLIIFGCFVSGGTALYYIDDFIKPFEERFNSNDLTSGNGRAVVFERFSEYQLDNPVTIPFGIGAVAYKDVSNIKSSMHNATQQILVCTGIAGLLIFIFAAYKFYNIYIYKRRVKLLYLIPMINAFLFVQSIQFLNPYFLMLPFIVGAMSVKLGEEKRLRLCKSI